jgi:hypothetical protein
LAQEAFSLLHARTRALEVRRLVLAPELAELLEQRLLVGTPPLRETLSGERAIAELAQRRDAGLEG